MCEERRKITMPAWHIPYLEKHNIYKLFYELARELVILQPDDHVYFLKLLLMNAVKSVRIPHIIILGSPKLNIPDLASQIADATGQMLITESMILEALGKSDFHRTKSQVCEEAWVYTIQALMNIHSKHIIDNGWILADCIKTRKVAKKLIEIGILPTHVFYFIMPYQPRLTDLLYCNVSSNWPEYRREILGIKHIFKKKLIEVPLEEYTKQEVVNKCVELIKIERVEEGPKQPRVLLLGPRGSGRKTQAKLLSEKLNVVHIDFEYFLCQIWTSDDEIGRKLRTCNNMACFQSDLLTKALNKKLLEHQCLEQGWVLTGYPFNVFDMKYIDCLQTPPNRVVFLECDLKVCMDRVSNRRVDVDTGNVIRLDVDIDDITMKRLKIHPKDRKDLISAELQYYCSQYGPLRKYCGESATVINANQPERWVHENIMAVISRDLPISSPRDPFSNIELEDNMPRHPSYSSEDNF